VSSVVALDEEAEAKADKAEADAKAAAKAEAVAAAAGGVSSSMYGGVWSLLSFTHITVAVAAASKTPTSSPVKVNMYSSVWSQLAFAAPPPFLPLSGNDANSGGCTKSNNRRAVWTIDVENDLSDPSPSVAQVVVGCALSLTPLTGDSSTGHSSTGDKNKGPVLQGSVRYWLNGVDTGAALVPVRPRPAVVVAVTAVVS
jgi:hypothetical protein